MKRRNADCGKLRRPLKRTKITENIYGSTFLYVRFLLVWGLVLLADFILEFRFEYLWPFWLLLRSVYDSFKYQGLAFSVFFVCIALTSDMICFLFIPVHWLFFAASTYVWVQYVWHTERGICLPTVSLWLLFVYIEASVRLKELRNLPFHLDLCRPFAAHCIGYPVVTLGFGFKSYIGYKMRQRKQKEVAKENDFYVQLLQQALPPEQQSITSSPEKSKSESKFQSLFGVLALGVLRMKRHSHNHSNSISPNNSNNTSSSSHRKTSATSASSANTKNSEVSATVANSRFTDVDVRECKRHHALAVNNHHHHHHHQHQHSVTLEKELEYMETHSVNNSSSNSSNNNHNSGNKRANINDFDDSEDLQHDKSFKANGVLHKVSPSNSGSSGSGGGGASHPASAGSTPVGKGWNSSNSSSQVKENNAFNSGNQSSGGGGSGGAASGGSKRNKNASKDNTANNLHAQKDEHVLRLEADIKRLKADLQASRQCEQDVRTQINLLLVSERSMKNELSQLQQDNENLQSKLHGLVTARQQDKQTIASLERKLQEERKCRSVLESQLATERKNKKAEEATARAVALATANARTECTESCKSRRRDLENDTKQLRRELKSCEERLRQTEREAQSLRQYKDSHSETEVLMSALSAMQDKNAHLENSLSAETRLKLDLFSALGEAKRQLEITQSHVIQRDKEIDDLKSKIAEVMAVMPQTTFSPVILDSSMISPPLYSSKYMGEDKITNSTLDPNALVYTPKNINLGSAIIGDM